MLPKPIHGDCDLWLLAWFSVASFSFAAPVAEADPIWNAIAARPYVVRGAERRLLDRAEQFLADEQWDDAVAALMQLLEPDDFRVVAVSKRRYISLAEYCHRLLAELPAVPLSRYRALIDPAAESWYRRGIAERDMVLMRRVVDKCFCSRWGDDALFALGELALQSGHYRTARDAWLRIAPNRSTDGDRLFYPNTDLPLATVHARLVLVSIREGNWERAEVELTRLKSQYPTARGRLGGREVVFADRLTSLLKQARRWSGMRQSGDGRTFAASSGRSNSYATPQVAGPYELLWSRPLSNERLATFPVVVNGLIVYQDDISVRALNLTDGEAAFAAEGKIFESPLVRSDGFGQTCHTLTATNRYVFGVTPSVLGSLRRSRNADVASTLWSLDLERDGALALHQPIDDSGAAFAGAPVVADHQLFVPVRSSDHTARAGIACYDLSTGERRWQRRLCQANTPATGRTSDITNNLLTYDSGVIYANTNLGAVAAVRVDDGRVLWLRTYNRQSGVLSGGRGGPYYRGPSPCVYYRGVVIVLPTDSSAVFALDAVTGHELWRRPVADPMSRLLGVTDDHVVLSDGGLQLCDYTTGNETTKSSVAHLVGWPALHAGGAASGILWPSESLITEIDPASPNTQEEIYALPGPGGANLLVAGEYLVAVGPTQLSVLRCQSRATDAPTDSQTSLKD